MARALHRLGRYCVALTGLMAASFSFGQAQAGSFTEDFAACAGGAVQLATTSAQDAVKAAEFAINHGECIPKVVALDPVLGGMTAGILGLQAANQLPRPTAQCKATIFTTAQRPVAGMINLAVNNTPGLSTIIPQSSRNRLTALANGAATESLYAIPGVAMVAENLSCGCAVAETGVPIEQLRDRSKVALETVSSCAGVVGHLFNGGYQIASTTVAAVQDVLNDIYGSFADGLSAMGCSIGISSCPSRGPPFFCVGYMQMRNANVSVDDLRKQWAQVHTSVSGMAILGSASSGAGSGPNPYDAMISQCETDYQNVIEEQRAKLDREARERQMAEQLANAERFADSFALRYFLVWTPDCQGDTACNDGLARLADQFGDDLADPETLAQFPNFPSAVMAMNEKYRSNARTIVTLARERRYRALRLNLTAPPAERLPAFGCNPYLGRAQQSLCENPAGFEACKGSVDANTWRLCYLAGPANNAGGQAYAKGNALSTIVRGAGCIAIAAPSQRTPIPTNSHRGSISRDLSIVSGLIASTAVGKQYYQCIGAAAHRTCQAFASGGSDVDCGPARAYGPVNLRPRVSTAGMSIDQIFGPAGLRAVPQAIPSAPSVPPIRNPRVTRPQAPAPAAPLPEIRRPTVRPPPVTAPPATTPPATAPAPLPRIRRPGH